MLSHTLLGYISALGAHRHQLDTATGGARLLPVAQRIAAYMEQLAASLKQRKVLRDSVELRTALLDELDVGALGAEAAFESEDYGALQTQLQLIVEQLAPLTEAADRLAAGHQEKAVQNEPATA